jgi:hypothetical protein
MFKANSEIEELIRKVALVSHNNSAVKPYWDVDTTYHKYKAYALEDAAGNHAFDDYPEIWGITKHEGHCLRAFFQSGLGCRNNTELRDYVESLLHF